MQKYFSERELTFTFAYAIARPSFACLSSVCLSVVCRLQRSCALLRQFKFSTTFLRH